MEESEGFGLGAKMTLEEFLRAQMPGNTAAYLRVGVHLDSGKQPVLSVHTWPNGQHTVNRFLVKKDGVMNLDLRGTNRAAQNSM